MKSVTETECVYRDNNTKQVNSPCERTYICGISLTRAGIQIRWCKIFRKKKKKKVGLSIVIHFAKIVNLICTNYTVLTVVCFPEGALSTCTIIAIDETEEIMYKVKVWSSWLLASQHAIIALSKKSVYLTTIQLLLILPLFIYLFIYVFFTKILESTDIVIYGSV